MKYIMYEKKIGDLTRKIPIIFPTELVHLDVAKALSKLVGTSRIVGAGSISIKVDGIGGESTTIGIRSKPEDEDIIAEFDYFHGIVNDIILQKMRGEKDGNTSSET